MVRDLIVSMVFIMFVPFLYNRCVAVEKFEGELCVHENEFHLNTTLAKKKIVTAKKFMRLINSSIM